MMGQATHPRNGVLDNSTGPVGAAEPPPPATPVEAPSATSDGWLAPATRGEEPLAGAPTASTPAPAVATAVVPRLVHERRLWRSGNRLVAGIDEVGRGAWAGPLSVGVAVMEAAVLERSSRRAPAGLRDSKQLPEERREAIFDRVASWCAAWAVGHVGPEECDRLGMTAALRLATRRALAGLPAEARPEAVILDGNFDYVSPPAAPSLFDEPDPPSLCRPAVRTVVGADATCASVAAASVLAKVTRDRIMRQLSDSFPPFDFERNKGYPSPTHKRALCGYGMTAIHRRSWIFAEHLPWR